MVGQKSVRALPSQCRYFPIPDAWRRSSTNIYAHSQKKPFSLSPNLESDIQLARDVALEHGIKQLHFWADHDAAYNLSYLVKLAQCLKSHGLEVYFDIQQRNVRIHWTQKLLAGLLSLR